MNWRTGLALGPAREKVRVARALADLPLLSAAMLRGRLSYSKARALTRIATPDNEASLLDFACSGTAAHVERLVRAWRKVDRIAEAEDDRRRHAGRHLETWVDDDGMLVLRGRLTPEVGAVVQRALEAATGQLYQTEAEGTQTDPAEEERPSAGQRRADALGLMAESALAANLDRGTAGDRYQVVIHVDAETLEEQSESGQGTLEDGVGVSAQTSRRLACDASLVTMRHEHHDQHDQHDQHDHHEQPTAAAPHPGGLGFFDPDREGAPEPDDQQGDRHPRHRRSEHRAGEREGAVLDVGRKTRTIPPAIRRALTARDRRCRFPGCQSRHCDAHHVQHWADGGPTRLQNLVLLCRRHHRAVHEEGFGVEVTHAGDVRFSRPNGHPFPNAPAAPTWTDHALAPTDTALATAGITFDAHTATPDWQGERLDLPWAISVLHRPATLSRTEDDVPAGIAPGKAWREGKPCSSYDMTETF